MILLPFLAGGATLVAAVVVFRLWLGMMPRSICPQCGQPTLAVGHALSGAVKRWLTRRWCAACQWVGWGRTGPVLWRRRGPVADGSGFRWGEDRLQPDFGFQWKNRRSGQDRRHTRADHPSGFRFAGAGQTETGSDAPADPSGFRFRAAASDAETARRDHPSGFSWAAGASEQAPRPRPAEDKADDDADEPPTPPGFTWGGQRPRQGFRWKN